MRMLYHRSVTPDAKWVKPYIFQEHPWFYNLERSNGILCTQVPLLWENFDYMIL